MNHLKVPWRESTCKQEHKQKGQNNWHLPYMYLKCASAIWAVNQGDVIDENSYKENYTEESCKVATGMHLRVGTE